MALTTRLHFNCYVALTTFSLGFLTFNIKIVNRRKPSVGDDLWPPSILVLYSMFAIVHALRIPGLQVTIKISDNISCIFFLQKAFQKQFPWYHFQ